MKAIVRFFRQRAINRFLKRKKSCILPDISKYPSIAILLDQDQFKRYKEIEVVLRRLFFLRKEDFNFWGLIKQLKKESLLCLSFDLVIDFTRMPDEELTNTYIITLINNSFRMTFGNTCPALYDMVIDSKKDDDMLNRIEILKNYLSMLLGQR
jgi:hypothetical protein